MINLEMVRQAQEDINAHWGEAVVLRCLEAESLHMTSKQFLEHCTACGGNWGGMLLTGIHELRPEVWEAIPDDMGPMAWSCICNTLVLLGVDTSE